MSSGASCGHGPRATVADPSQRSRTARLTASVKVLVGAAAPAPATGGVVLPLSMPFLVLIVILLLGGGLLVGFAARRRFSRHSAHGERPPNENRPVRLALAQSGTPAPGGASVI